MIWAVRHTTCDKSCTFSLGIFGLLARQRFLCEACQVDVPEAIVFMLQAMGVYDRMEANHHRWVFLYASRVLQRQRKKKDHYLSDLYEIMAIGPR